MLALTKAVDQVERCAPAKEPGIHSKCRYDYCISNPTTTSGASDCTMVGWAIAILVVSADLGALRQMLSNQDP